MLQVDRGCAIVAGAASFTAQVAAQAACQGPFLARRLKVHVTYLPRTHGLASALGATLSALFVAYRA